MQTQASGSQERPYQTLSPTPTLLNTTQCLSQTSTHNVDFIPLEGCFEEMLYVSQGCWVNNCNPALLEARFKALVFHNSSILWEMLFTLLWKWSYVYTLGLSGGSVGKESTHNVGDLGSIPGLGKFPGEGNGLPTPVVWPGEFHDRGAWWATVHGVSKSQTWPSYFHFHTFHIPTSTIVLIPVHLEGFESFFNTQCINYIISADFPNCPKSYYLFSI